MSLLKSRKQEQRNLSFTRHAYCHVSPVCMCVCFCSGGGDKGEMAYVSLPLSLGQRSSSPAGVSVDSSFLQPLSSSSDLAQCAGMALKHPVKDMMCEQNKEDTESNNGI